MYAQKPLAELLDAFVAGAGLEQELAGRDRLRDGGRRGRRQGLDLGRGGLGARPLGNALGRGRLAGGGAPLGGAGGGPAEGHTCRSAA